MQLISDQHTWHTFVGNIQMPGVVTGTGLLIFEVFIGSSH